VRVLAFDTATARGSVALVGEDGVCAEARVESAHRHSRWLLGTVEALLRGLDLAPADLDAFAVTVGPGSFTGLRVGLSSVQGLAVATGRPCVGRCTLDVLAVSAEGTAPIVVPLMDAFRGEVYWAVYGPAGAPPPEPRVAKLEVALQGLPAGTAFVGDAAAQKREVIRDAVPGAVFPDPHPFLASTLGRLALGDLAQGRAVPPSALRPLYVRAADIRPSGP
jgi:tRNA threonylcarbamoyladenosine biosynthesis protein TsaB